MLNNPGSENAYLVVIVTQGAAAEAQQDLKDALLVAQLIAMAITYPFFQHIQDPLTLHLVLKKEKKKKSRKSYSHR